LRIGWIESGELSWAAFSTLKEQYGRLLLEIKEDRGRSGINLPSSVPDIFLFSSEAKI
jgi:hypothetical protein